MKVEKYNFFAFFSNWLFLFMVGGALYFAISEYQKAAFKDKQYYNIQNEFFEHISEFIPNGQEFYHFEIEGDSLAIGSYTDFAKREFKIIKKQFIETRHWTYDSNKKEKFITNPKKYIKVNMIDWENESNNDQRINKYKIINNEYVPYSEPLFASENIGDWINKALYSTDYRFRPNQKKYHQNFYWSNDYGRSTFSVNKDNLVRYHDKQIYALVENFYPSGKLMALSFFVIIPNSGKDEILYEAIFDEDNRILRVEVYDNDDDFTKYIKIKTRYKIRLYTSNNVIGATRNFSGNDRLRNGNTDWGIGSDELDRQAAKLKSFRENRDREFSKFKIKEYSYDKSINLNYKYDEKSDKLIKIKQKSTSSSKKKSTSSSKKKPNRSSKKKSTNSTKTWNWNSKNERHLLIQFVNEYFNENNGPSMSENDLTIKLLAFFNGNYQKSSNAKGWKEFRKNNRRNAAGISPSRFEKIKKNLRNKNYDYIIEENIYRTAKGQELWMRLKFPYIRNK